ncbi:MAG: DUF6504 family protein [bacterium]|jgi:hypothetical protein
MLKPVRFIGEVIEVIFDRLPLYKKRPPCPDGFVWKKEAYRVTETLNEWQDFSRKGRMARNMRPKHHEAALSQGSWGVGRTYFRVRIAEGRVFDLYYDRAPSGGAGREGGWFLYRELQEDRAGEDKRGGDEA